MKLNWQSVLVVLCCVVVVLWAVGCVSKTPPPPELAKALDLSPKQREGVSGPELDGLWRAYLQQQEDERQAKADQVEKDKADAAAAAETKAAETAAKVEDLKAEGQLTIENLEAEHRAKLARAQVDLSKQIRQAGSDGQAAVLAIARQADASAAAFKDWARKQTATVASTKVGYDAGKADIDRQDWLKQTAAAVGLQAATPWLPAGALGILGMVATNWFGRKQGQAQAEEPTRAVLAAAKQAGVLQDIGKHIEAHAEPDDIAALARIGMKDNAAIPTPIPAPKLVA